MSENPYALAKPGTIEHCLANPGIRARFNEMLGARAPQFISSIITLYKGFPNPVDPSSVVASAAIAATLDLPIERSLGFAHIVPYGGQAQFQIGWKGLVQLAYRSGQYSTITPPSLINKEAYKGRDRIGQHKIDWDAVDETKEPVGVAFAWRLVNGGESIFFWPMGKIDEHARRYSKAFAKGANTPWKTHYPEMCKKTVVKNSLSQFGSLSVQMQTAIKYDQSVVKELDAEPQFIDNPNILPPKPPVSSQSEQQGTVDDDEAAEAAAGLAPVPTQEPAKPAARGRKPKLAALKPAAPPPEPELEPIDLSELDTADKGYSGRVLMKLTTAMIDAEVTEEQVMQFCVEVDLANDNQTELSQLATKKLLEICSRWPDVVKQIKINADF